MLCYYCLHIMMLFEGPGGVKINERKGGTHPLVVALDTAKKQTISLRRVHV